MPSQRIITQKLIYIAEKIINPQGILLHEGYFETAPDTEGARAAYNFCAIPIYGHTTLIRSISATLAENYSSTGRSVHPVTQIALYLYNNKTLSFLSLIPENKLTESNLHYDGIKISQYSDLERSYKTTDNDNTVSNVIEFDSTLDNKLLYLPRHVRGLPSILDSMRKFYQFSFIDSYIIKQTIIVPSQTKYILIFPLSTIPIRSSFLLGSSGSLSIGINLNLVLEEITEVDRL